MSRRSKLFVSVGLGLLAAHIVGGAVWLLMPARDELPYGDKMGWGE